jgi:hypothetical protein
VGRRITGSSVSKGDLVARKFSQMPLFGLNRDKKTGKIIEDDEVGIVMSTLPPYDRNLIGVDCYVFWSRKSAVLGESSSALHILSHVYTNKC